MKIQNYLKVLEEAIEEMEDIRDISKYVLYLQIENARYLCSIKEFEFYDENKIKIIDWQSYFPNLNLIENIWAIK